MKCWAVSMVFALSGCTAIGAGSISAVNLTAEKDVSHSNAGYTGVLIGAAVFDAFIIGSLIAQGEFLSGLDTRELATDLARGDGAFVHDLAAALALPEAEVPRLGEQLRRHRPALLDALRRPAPPAERVSALQAAIGSALADDPDLLQRLQGARDNPSRHGVLDLTR